MKFWINNPFFLGDNRDDHLQRWMSNTAFIWKFHLLITHSQISTTGNSRDFTSGAYFCPTLMPREKVSDWHALFTFTAGPSSPSLSLASKGTYQSQFSLARRRYCSATVTQAIVCQHWQRIHSLRSSTLYLLSHASIWGRAFTSPMSYSSHAFSDYYATYQFVKFIWYLHLDSICFW